MWNWEQKCRSLRGAEFHPTKTGQRPAVKQLETKAENKIILNIPFCRQYTLDWCYTQNRGYHYPFSKVSEEKSFCRLWNKLLWASFVVSGKARDRKYLKGSSFRMNIIFLRKQPLSGHDPTLQTNPETMYRSQKCMCVYEISHNL